MGRDYEHCLELGKKLSDVQGVSATTSRCSTSRQCGLQVNDLREHCFLNTGHHFVCVLCYAYASLCLYVQHRIS